MASQMKRRRRHLRVLCSVPSYSDTTRLGTTGSTLLSLVCFVLLGIVKPLSLETLLPALISPKKWVVLPSERQITDERILTPTFSSCVASHFFPSDVPREPVLNVYRKQAPHQAYRG